MTNWLSRYGHFIELGINVALPLAGIFFFHWSVGDIFLLFFVELLFIVGFASLKILFAFKAGGFFTRIGRIFKLLLLFTMLYIFILIVAGHFFDGSRAEMVTTIGREGLLILLGNYAAGFFISYIASGKFREADHRAITRETLLRAGAILGVLIVVLVPLGIFVPYSHVNFLLGAGLVIAKNTADYFLVYREKGKRE